MIVEINIGSISWQFLRINDLRSASDDLNSAWPNESQSDSSDTDSGAKLTQLEPIIERLQASCEQMENKFKECQDFSSGTSNVKFLLSS